MVSAQHNINEATRLEAEARGCLLRAISLERTRVEFEADQSEGER